MIDELQKRPFARPLLIWICGICLYVLFSEIKLIICLLLGLLMLLAFSGREIAPEYRARWQWGFFYTVLLLAMSVSMSAWQDLQIESGSLMIALEAKATSLRGNLLERLHDLNLPKNSLDVLSAILLGESKDIASEVRKQFSITGVAHILSVSGFHVAVVGGFISFLLTPLPSSRPFRWVKYGSVILVLWSFAILSGLAPPTIRAAFMLTLFLVGKMLNYSSDGYNTLAASAFIMLVCNPFYLFDIGFQLSYLAVWFILLLLPKLNGLLKIRNPLFAEPYSWIMLAIAAQAGTAFLCLYYFSQFPTLFLFANLPFSLVSTLLLPFGLVYLFLPQSFPGISVLEWIIESMMRFLMYIVDSFSLFSWAAFIIPFDFIDLLFGYAALFSFVFFIYKRSPKLLILSCFWLLILLLKLLLEPIWLSTP